MQTSQPTVHPWVSDTDDVDDPSYVPSQYVTEPASVLTGSLSGMVWRWKRSAEWLRYTADTLVGTIVSQAIELNAPPVLVEVLSQAAKAVALWMKEVQVCNKVKNAIDLGLISPPTYTQTNFISRDSNCTVAFITATRNLLLMDIIFWRLDSNPKPTVIPPQHPVYNLPSTEEFTNPTKSTAYNCLRLLNWENSIIVSSDITATNNSSAFDSVSEMEVDQGLVYIVEASAKATAWAKVIRNFAAAALAIRSLISPDSKFEKSRAAMDRAIISACSMSPIILLFPETIDAHYREITRYEWRMMWRYGQPVWAGRRFDDKTAYMEGKLWDLLIEISTGLPNIAPITQDPQGTSSGPSSGQHKISTARLKQAILNAREEMAKFQGIEATASMTRTVPLKKKEKKVPAHDFEALRGENESLKAQLQHALEQMRALKIETGSLFRMDMDDLDASDIHNGSGIPEGYDTLDTPGTPRTTDSSKVPNVPDILRTPHKREASGTPDADVRKVPNLGDVSDNLDPGEASDTPNALKARDTSKVPDAPDVTHAPNLPKVPDAPDVTHTPNVPKTPNTPDALEAPDSHDMSPGRHDSVVNAGASIDWVKSEALPGDINDTSTAVGEVRTISGKASTGVKVEQVGVEDSGIRDSGYRSESRDGSDDVEALTDRRLLCGCLLVTTRLQIRSCGREYLHTPWVQTTRIDHLKQLLESLPDALPEGDESYFPSAPRDWNLEEFDKAEGDHGLILEQWFKSAYGDPTNMGKQDVSKEDSDRFAALAAEQGPCAARQVDASVFWARGQRSSELIDALQSAYSWVREHDKETIQLDLILLEFLNCAKNTFRRWNIKIPRYDCNPKASKSKKRTRSQFSPSTSSKRVKRSQNARMSTRAQKRHHSDVEADDEVESENDEPVVRSDQHSKRSRTGTLPPLIRIDQIMRKKKLHNDSNIESLPDLKSIASDENTNVICEKLDWHTWSLSSDGLEMKDVSLIFPILESEKEKVERDRDLDDDEKAPSLQRDWDELKEIIEAARVLLPTTPNREADETSQSFLRVLDGNSLGGKSMADAEALFRNHAILIIWPNPNLPWDDDAAERILEERPSARVPVHVLNERTIENNAVLMSTTISSVIEEGRSQAHRPLNVLSIPLTVPGMRSDLERMLDSDTYSWHATNNHPEAIVRHVPSKTKWWGMVSLSGSMHSPHIDADGLCTTMTVTVGYKVFVICSDPNSFSLALNARKGLCIEDCLKSAKWEVVVIPPGATLILPAGHMHFAFTPQLEGSNVHGSIARGSHFYSWCRLSDTLLGIWRIVLTNSAVTNAIHSEAWTLLARMLLDLSVRLEEGLPLPSPVDMGAILVLILRSKDLGFGGSDDILTNFLEIARIRAELVKENVRQNVPEAYAESGRLDAALTLWIQSQSDLDSEGIARMGLE